jgi:tight adherence protein B
MEGLAFLSGIGVGVGLLVIYRSLSVEIATAAGALAKRALWMRRARQSTLASVVSLVVVLATGWPMAGVLAWCFVVAAPGIFGGKKAAERTIARTESIASWIENLHDTLMGSSGLHRAIVTTAQTAPEPIHVEVQELAAGLERRDPFAMALDRFAQSLDDPAADLVAMTLVMADDPNRHASDVGAVLQKLGTSLREEAGMLRRVHASRASARTGVNAIAVITIGMALGLAVFNNSFLQPYNSFTGQLMLLVVGGTFALSFWYLHRMVKPMRTQRFFVNIAGSNGRR